MSTEGQNGAAENVSAAEIEDVLRRVVENEVFTGAPRLQDFLIYVVRKHLESPEKKIPAKAIAHDIYDRPLDSGVDNENIVRVDAGRLRRRLADYYAGPGNGDPLFIHIDPGGYSPRFEVRTEEPSDTRAPEAESAVPGKNRNLAALAAAIALVSVTGGVAIGFLANDYLHFEDRSKNSGEPSALPDKTAERLALLEKSPKSIQAVNLAEQARNMIFPMFELDQLDLTLRMFRQAIRKDDRYFGGYAGAAQSLGTMAIFLPEGLKRDKVLLEAQGMALRAMDMAPTEAWTQSAAAWVAYQEGNDSKALRLSEQAVSLAPYDGNVLDFHAVLLLLMGDFEGSKSASDSDRKRLTAQGRLANRGFNGAARFHLGDYQGAVAILKAAHLKGDPISAPTLAYLAASHQALGNRNEARRYAQQLAENWPAFRADRILGRIYRSKQQALEVHERLVEAGWRPQPDDNPVEANQAGQ
jgi:tetratricopeptide (TPR) repeat protein